MSTVEAATPPMGAPTAAAALSAAPTAAAALEAPFAPMKAAAATQATTMHEPTEAHIMIPFY